jgi:hypothetical protein
MRKLLMTRTRRAKADLGGAGSAKSRKMMTISEMKTRNGIGHVGAGGGGFEAGMIPKHAQP